MLTHSTYSELSTKAIRDDESQYRPQPRLALCWQQGQIVDAATATVSVLDHGLLYGDGVFEGIRFYRRQPFRLAAHLQRLVDSARAIGLVVPMTALALSAAIEQLIAAFATDDGYLRLVVTRGVGPMGIDPSRCQQPQVFIIASALQFISQESRHAGAKVIIASTRRLSADGVDPRIKSLNYLNHILARMEANHCGADEAILLNREGRVAEGSADNVFVVKRNVLFTPPVTEGALDGITTRRCDRTGAAAGHSAARGAPRALRFVHR